MNELKVNYQESIALLHGKKWSIRKISRELGLDRATVRKYVAKMPKSPTHPQTGSAPGLPSNLTADPTAQTVSPELGGSKSPTNPQTGSAPGLPSNSTTNPTAQTVSPEPGGSKSPTNPQTGSEPDCGPESLCEPWRQQIIQALKDQLSVQRIYQDLVLEHQFKGSYYSVRRFVLRLGGALPELPFRRMECEPGEQAQVDFGQGAWVINENGKLKRPHLFRIILSYSRKAYSEVVWRQTTEDFIRCLENSFRYFGGVPKTLVIDNLRAAVTKADWFDPELTPKIVSFCEHYGTVILPTKPRMPRHKGKVESGVNYAQENGVKARRFEGLASHNLGLLEWERTVADTRIHGTTKQQVARVFNEVEKPRLLPLPMSLFPLFKETKRSVHLDGYIEVDKAYYSVPPEYLRCNVWVRSDTRLVRVFNLRMEQIALHARHEPGKFATQQAHIHSHKRTIIERGADWMLDRARSLGKYSGTWAEQMFAQRGPQSIRVLQGLLSLAQKHPVAALERACQLAIEHGAWRLRDLRELLERAAPPPQQQFTFLESHPLIRDLEAYDNLIPVCFASKNADPKNITQ